MTDAHIPARRYVLRIEYDGTGFAGWQVQSNGRTVQQEIENALHGLFGSAIRVHGAGRTDAGVHARGQTAHFDAPGRHAPAVLLRALNAELPPDIAILSVAEAAPDFHARFQASSRAYTYSIHHGRTALHRARCWQVHGALDHDRIFAAVRPLLGTRDFRSFSRPAPQLAHHLCHVFFAEWVPGADTSQFHIRANRFLHGMVRALVGGLVQVGRGKRTPADIADMLAHPDHTRIPMLAPPQGLVLEDVRYDAAEWTVVERAWAAHRAAADGEGTE